jgi:hypothetical protein
MSHLPLVCPMTAGAYCNVYTSLEPAGNVIDGAPDRLRPVIVASRVTSFCVGFLTITSNNCFFCKPKTKRFLDIKILIWDAKLYFTF